MLMARISMPTQYSSSGRLRWTFGAVGVDFFTTGTYKWLMAGFGVAPFYVRRELLDRIQTRECGLDGREEPAKFQYQHYRTAKKFEFSSPAFGQLYELAAALAYLRRIGLG